MRKVITLLVLASEERARILENAGPDLTEVEGVERTRDETEREQPSDRSGSVAAGGGRRHTLEPHSQAEERLRRRFAAKIVGAMADRLAARPFDRLVISAGPKMLGCLRAELTPDLRRRLVFDIDKELIDLPLAELSARFTQGLGF